MQFYNSRMFVKENPDRKKKCETCRALYKVCVCSLEYISIKDNLTENKCSCFNKHYQQKLNERLTLRRFEGQSDPLLFFKKKCIF